MFFCGCLLAGCGNNDAHKLDVAADVVNERPDSALIIMKDVDYYGLSTDKQRASYAMTLAQANVGLGRSLVSDSLLGKAVDYYREERDTLSMVLAARFLVGHLWALNRYDEAFKVVGDMISQVGDNRQLQWELHQQRLELAIVRRDFDAAIKDIDCLLELTGAENHYQRFRLKYNKAFALYFIGEKQAALELADSILSAYEFIGLYKSPEWQSFKCDYAEILDEVGRSRDAINVLETVMQNHDNITVEDKIGYYISMARFQINDHNFTEAARYIDAFDTMDVDTLNIDYELRLYVELLRSCIMFHRSGRLSFMGMANVSKGMVDNYRRSRNERSVAIESMDELAQANYKMVIARQRMWLTVIIVVVALLFVMGLIYFVAHRRKMRLVEAEERIETLGQMVLSLKNTAADDANSMLKKLLLQQLGIIKAFAEAPTAHNQEALKKISSIGNDGNAIDGLVSWPELYSMIDRLFDGFHANIEKTYPDKFIEKEIQILCLIKAGFSTKEIGVLTQQSSATIYVRKTSIRHKLALPEKDDFIVFLDSKFDGLKGR